MSDHDEYDPDLHDDGMERVFGSCAAWLQGIRRHQIRDVTFEALVQGAEFGFRVEVISDGRVRGIAFNEQHDIVWTGEEPAPQGEHG